jgi:hypothetical protein
MRAVFPFRKKEMPSRIVIIIITACPSRPSLLPRFARARAPLCAKKNTAALFALSFVLLRVLFFFSEKKKGTGAAREVMRGETARGKKEEEKKGKGKVRVRSINIFPQKGDPTAHLE